MNFKIAMYVGTKYVHRKRQHLFCGMLTKKKKNCTKRGGEKAEFINQEHPKKSVSIKDFLSFYSALTVVYYHKGDHYRLLAS